MTKLSQTQPKQNSDAASRDYARFVSKGCHNKRTHSSTDEPSLRSKLWSNNHKMLRKTENKLTNFETHNASTMHMWQTNSDSCSAQKPNTLRMQRITEKVSSADTATLMDQLFIQVQTERHEVQRKQLPNICECCCITQCKSVTKLYAQHVVEKHSEARTMFITCKVWHFITTCNFRNSSNDKL